ncbi:MAG: transporter associated domain-containing protein, partial [Pseudomonadota bacterium]
YATAVMTALVVVFAEVLPKTAAIARPDGFAMTVAPVMRFFVFLFAPITGVVQFIVRRALRLFGLNVEEQAAVLSAADELRGAIDLHHEEGRVEERARQILRGALDLEEITLEEIMVHRKSMQMLDVTEPCSELVQKALDSPHTRLPLWKDNPENIVGVLHAKDLLRAWWEAKGDVAKIDIYKIARRPYFVPETTPLTEQLDAFKRKKEHFALVVDEYGALMGLVTLEDILEEIVGEIEDEHDIVVRGVRPQADGSVNVDGDVSIRELNRARGWELPDDDAVTIAGLVINESQCIPEPGQVFSFHGFRFEILRRQKNQITALKIKAL